MKRKPGILVLLLAAPPLGLLTKKPAIGKNSLDFDATETIWKFFAANGRGKKTKGIP